MDRNTDGRYFDEESNAQDRQQSSDSYHDESPSEEETFLPRPSESLGRVGMEEPGSLTRRAWQSRLQNRIPPRATSLWKTTATWVKGPDPPRIFTISPFLPSVQHAPLGLLDRYAPKRYHRFWLLVVFYLAWLLSFILIQWKSSFTSDIPGYGAPVTLWCGATYWFVPFMSYKSDHD